MDILKYAAWRNGAVLEFNACTENIFFFFYLALINGNLSSPFVTAFFVFYLFSALATSYGYLVNDLGDRELDKRHNKPNVFSQDSRFRAVAVVLICFAGAFFLSLYFRHNRTFLVLWGIWILIATFYSLPPLRFKERGKIGLLFIVAAQRLIPALLIFSVFGRGRTWDAALIILYITNRGFISDIRHQLEDAGRDRSTGTRTFASENKIRAGAVFKRLLQADLILQGLVHIACLRTLPKVIIAGVPLPVSLPVFIAFICGILLIIFKPQVKTETDPYYDRGASNFIHLGLPSFYFPLYLLLVMTIQSPINLAVLVFFLLVTRAFSPDKIKNSLPVRLLGSLRKR